MNDLRQLITEHLNKVNIMQLATQKDGQPWCCTVHFAADDDLNIYWMSLPTQRHSQEIGDRAKAAVAMAIESRPGHRIIGVQVEGDAKRIDDMEKIKEVFEFYGHHRGEEWRQNVLAGKSEDKLYCITPRLIQLFDTQNFPHDPKQEWRP